MEIQALIDFTAVTFLTVSSVLLVGMIFALIDRYSRIFVIVSQPNFRYTIGKIINKNNRKQFVTFEVIGGNFQDVSFGEICTIPTSSIVCFTRDLSKTAVWKSSDKTKNNLSAPSDIGEIIDLPIQYLEKER